MAPKHHDMPLSGGDRKALKKELSKSRAMTRIFAERAEEKRREGEALIGKPTTFRANRGTNVCGRTAVPSIRRRQSIRPSTADTHGWRLNARAA